MSASTSWLQQQINEREDYKNEGKYQRRITIKSVICNKTVKGWFFVTLFACVVPILVYYLIIDQGAYKTTDLSTCSVKTTFRVPCGKINISSTDCEKLHCCYEISSETCYHYLPSKYFYNLDEKTEDYVTSQSASPYGTNSVEKLKISVNEISKDKVSLILHETGVKVDANKISGTKNYKIVLPKEKLVAEVYRSSTKDVLLTTAMGPLIASKNYWEWSFYLTDEYMFGLNGTRLKLNENSTFSKVIYKSKYDHYTLPIFWAYKNNQFHGVVIKHDGPIEVVVLPSYMVLLKSLTGEKIELELSLGPTPKNLHDQQITTSNPPPFWTLDTFMCRKGNNVNLTEIMQLYNIEETTTNDCIHENLYIAIMKYNGTDVDILRNITSQLKEKGLKFLLPIPPHIFAANEILYNRAVELDILYQYNGSEYLGKYFKEDVAYPDYTHANIQSYMTELWSYVATYIDIADIDGFILYDNWPRNDVFKVDNSSLPYISEGLMESMSYTLPWNATIKNGSVLHVQNHNLYGSSQISSIEQYFNSTKPDIFIMSSGKTFGETYPTIVQNVNTSWNNLKDHIDNVLFNSIVGNHLVSVPVCGDTTIYSSTIQETLCIRWYLAATTMPILRVGSDNPYRDPKNLNTLYAAQVAEKALQLRQSLLPYYYTILMRNEPVVRPMFYDFYENTTTFSLRKQYMVGENILVAHPFSSGRMKLRLYLPSRIGMWYEIWGGRPYNTTKDPWVDVDVVETDFVAFVAQGSVLPLLTDNIFNLIIALNCTSSPCSATGSLYQGTNYMIFDSSETLLTVKDIPQENCNYTLSNVTLYSYNKDTNVVKLYTKESDLCSGGSQVTITYESEDEVL